MDNVISLQIKLQLDDTIKINNGFGIQYNNNKYIVSIHHNLPIMEVYDKYDNKLDVIVNSCWSEVLILSKSSFLSCYTKISNKIPKISDVVYFYIDNEKYMLNITNINYIGFDNIDNKLTIPYIICNPIDEITDEKILYHLSGSPVFCDNKVIGIISKFNKRINSFYVLPIYIALKNITKKDNNIYNINYDVDDIKKISKYNITNNTIYHSMLNINVPITSYFLIESDIDTIYKITNNCNEKVVCNCVMNNKLYLSNETDILYTDDRRYKLNLRLMTLLNSKLDLEKKKDLLTQIFKRYQENNLHKIIYY